MASLMGKKPSSSEFISDILIWGSAGFTGKIIAKYFAKSGPSGLKVALGGRNITKLQNLKSDLEGSDCNCTFRIVVASAEDEDSVLSMIKNCKVVISAVGPYLLHGFTILEACVRFRVHYCDLVGEYPFVRESIRRFHTKAQENGTIILHCCGYDSIPSDLGTLMVVNYLQETFGRKCKSIEAYQSIKGSAGGSGGTIASCIAISSLSWKEVRDTFDNYYLCNIKGKSTVDIFIPRYDKEQEGWTLPFPMCFINNKIVHKSNEILGYGTDFHYMERFSPKSFWKIFCIFLVLLFASFVLMISPLRFLASKLVPQSGEGPTEKQQNETSFRTKLVGKSEDGKEKVVGIVEGFGDPGYKETSRMVAETALCLLLENEKIPGKKGGVLTPASGLGIHLMERLRNSGMKLEIVK